MMALIQYTVLVMMMGSLVLVAVGGVLARPVWVATGLILVVCVATQPSSYGMTDITLLSKIYALGMNTFYLSLFEIGLLLIWVCTLFLIPRPTFPLKQDMWHKIFIAYALLALMMLLFVMADRSEVFSDEWLMNFDKFTFVTLLWQGIFVYICTKCLSTRRDMRTLMVAMVTTITLNHVWGLFRYAVLGGDPQNAYASLEKLALKITFWDINDSVMAAFLIGYGLFRFLAEPQRSVKLKSLDIGLILLAVASIALSARRTAQGGLVFALLGTLICLPKGKRGVVILVMALSIPVALIATAQRSSGSGSVIDKVMLDVKSSKVDDPRNSRFYEWKRAWASIQESPWIGLGPKGAFRVIDDTGLEYHRHNFGFMHSGFGHILLKTGFIGLSLYLFILGVLIYNVKRTWAGLPNAVRPACVGAVASLFASLPNFTVGTPLVEIRTMLCMGVMMSILIVCSRFSSGHSEQLWDESATVLMEFRH
jgi:O-antigen ligase